ncbi:MAG: NAD(+)/NADH kinase [Phycisphaeraceae bacterium]|nr:NAD(+)/NADH kinase [Phycisphaeraceae bacterium]
MSAVLLLATRSRAGVGPVLEEVRRIVARHAMIVAEMEADHTAIPPSLSFDRAVVVGGDGTLISQCRRMLDRGVPLVGVHFGRLGFLAEFDDVSLATHAEQVFGPDPLVRTRMALDAVVRNAAGETVFQSIAVNDAVVTAGPPFRMIELRLHFGGEEGPLLTGDGVIVATPVGSTAYNASSGGPIVHPENEALIVTPIAPHSLSFRPIVAPSHEVLEIEVLRANEGTTLVLDGQETRPLARGERVSIARYHTQARFIGNPQVNYWRTLIEKMRWAVPPNYRS